jgi:hypothetical protein
LLARCALLAALSLNSNSARADPFESLRALILHPADPRVMVLRYESGYGGLLISRDGGHSFSILPSSAITKYALRGNVPMHFTRDGKLLLALDDGLYVDDGQGCQFSASGSLLENAWVVDLALHPSDPDIVFVLTMASPSGDVHAGLWRRTATEMTPLGASDPAPPPRQRNPIQPTSLKVVARAASVGGVRFIEGALVADEGDAGSGVKAVLRVSDDQGATWETHEISARREEIGLPRILAVEGDDPFRALVALQVGSNEDTSEQAQDPFDLIFLTSDSGATFSPYSAALRMADQALLLPNGQVLIADRGPGGGLWSAANIGGSLTKVQEFPVHCLGYRPEDDTVFLCKGYELGVYDLTTHSFCAFFQNREVQALVSCPSQPLADTPKVIDQLCNKWCGALHFASSPVCASLTSPRAMSCVAAARAYDSEAGHIEAPLGNPAPRCSPPPPPLSSDAGVAADGGEDAELDDERASDEDLPPTGRSSNGCGCRLARTHGHDGASSVVAALTLCAFVYRRRAQRRELKRARSA